MTTTNDIPELLAPARDREAFLAAVAAGADAIYCGVTGGLNARRKAAGIGEDELAGLCALAHSRGVRVYVTANIVVKQAELPGAIEALGRVLAAGADALIIQDLGLMDEVCRVYPTAEIHVSTQANVHDARGVALCAELGATRVTLSRELPLDEIAAIAEAERKRAAACGGVPCELEVFAHGAICPSYSGLCMLSSFLREGRSPNRGLCAQPCRLPFDLVRAGTGERLQAAERERPLCTHDNCAIADIAALSAAGVASLKLEGRMKPPAYVHAVTSAWRHELDAFAGKGADASALPEGWASRRVLKRSFNRGLTDAYLHGTSGDELMSYERSGNRGELVGEVAGFEPEPGFVPRDGQQLRGEALVALREPVGEGDSLELRHPAEPERFMVVQAPRVARPGEELRLRVPRPMPAGCEVRLTKSVVLERAAQQAVETVTKLERFSANAGISQKTGEFDDSLLGAVLPSGGAGRAEPSFSCDEGAANDPAVGVAPSTPELCALVARPQDAAAVRGAGATRVYLDVSGLEQTPELVASVRENGLVPVLGEVCREPDHGQIDPWMRQQAPVVVANPSELALASECGALGEAWTCLPVHNVAALRRLACYGARAAWLSPELSLEEAGELVAVAGEQLGADACTLGAVVYGRPRLMTCEHCVLQVAYECDRNHEACPHRRRAHELVNIDGRHLPVRTDAAGRSRVYLDQPVDLVAQASELTAAGVRRLLVDATTTSLADACEALGRLRVALVCGDGAIGSQDSAFTGLLGGGVA